MIEDKVTSSIVEVYIALKILGCLKPKKLMNVLEQSILTSTHIPLGQRLGVFNGQGRIGSHNEMCLKVPSEQSVMGSGGRG